MMVELKHKQSGFVKQVKLGFSWTTFFFGFLPALFRMDWINALIIAGVVIVTFGFAWIVFPFIYNKMYIKRLLKDGWEPANEEGKNALKSKEIFV